MDFFLFGASYEAEKLIYNNAGILDSIKGVFDSNKCGEIFHGHAVKPLDELLSLNMNDNCLIIVAAAEYATYRSMKGLLDKCGKSEFSNYIWSKVVGKKLVLINANCYGEVIEEFLKTSPSFEKEYFIYPLPVIHENRERTISEKLLMRADVYIHQDIQAKNSFGYGLSDEYIIPKLKKGCADITIPNLVGQGKWMYPWLGAMEKIVHGMERNILVYYRDYSIDHAIEHGKTSIKEIRDYIDEYCDEPIELRDLFNKSMSTIYEREKRWDIKVSQFIKENYKKIPCFVDGDHPSCYLMGVICKQLAELLDIHDVDEHFKYGLGYPVPIMEYVKKYFGMNFELPQECRGRLLFGRNDYSNNPKDEYIRGYVWWYYGKRVQGE